MFLDTRMLLDKLCPSGRCASYDPSRACLPGARGMVMYDVKGWARDRDGFEKLLWVHGHAGFGKNSTAVSIRNQLVDEGEPILVSSFFFKRLDAGALDC
jgi:hypothetical protein